MRHHLETLLIFLSSCLSIMAQDNYEQHRLNVEDLSDGVSVFSTDGNWAGVIVQCKKQYNLNFVSDVDDGIIDVSSNPEAGYRLYRKKTAFLIKTEEDNSNKYYHFKFLTDRKYENRIITVRYPYLQPCDIHLRYLSPKVLYRYRVYDEDDASENTKFQEHNMKGQRYFRDCNYMAAKQEFTLAKYCVEATEEDKGNVQVNINKCDSIIHWMQEGNRLAEMGLYNNAAQFFLQAAIQNYTDRYAYNRFYELSRKESNLCSIYYAEAEKNFREKTYETAKELYQTVAERGCSQEELAKKRMTECESLIRKRINTERFFGLDFGLGEYATMGFTSGSYKKHVGSYISLRTNQELFELARNNYKMDDVAILDITFIGITIPVVKPQSNIFQGLWVNAGIGGSAMNRYKIKEADALLEETGKENYDDLAQDDIDAYIETNGGKSSDFLKPDIGFAVSPEIGLFVKVWRLGLRLNYQRRIIISESFKGQKQAKESLVSFGLGFCF